MWEFFKNTVDAIAGLCVLPLILLYRLGSRACGSEGVFPGWSQFLSVLPGHWGMYLRRAFYQSVLPRCARDAYIGFGTVFSHPTAELGRRAYVGLFCGLGDVELGDDVLVASHVSIINGGAQHGMERLDVPIREQPGRYPRVTIGEGVWIGERAVVMADVGKHCVIGAGAVVTRPIPDYAIALGIPARVVRYREGAPIPAPMAVVLPIDTEEQSGERFSSLGHRGLGG